VVVDQGGVRADLPQGLQRRHRREQIGLGAGQAEVGQQAADLFGVLVQEDPDAGGVQQPFGDLGVGGAVVGLGLQVGQRVGDQDVAGAPLPAQPPLVL
jgi:hypothetical protein